MPEAPLRILHVTPYYTPATAFGGVVSAVSALASECAALGQQVTVLTTDALNQQGARVPVGWQDTGSGVRVVRLPNLLPSLRGRYNLSTPRDLGSVAHRLIAAADVVHLHEFRTIEALIVTRHAQRLGVPVVVSPHGTLAQHTGRSGLKRLWDRWLSPAVAQRIAAAIVLTEDEAADTRTLWDTFWPREQPLPIHIIPNGIALLTPVEDEGLRQRVPAFRASWGLDRARVVLFVGRLHARKGVEVLVQAFLHANLPDTRLLLVGPDDGMAATATAFTDPRIILTGLLDPTETAVAQRCASVFVLPAVGEGLPMAALEALVAGTPVILSPECHLPQVAEYGAGLIVEPQVTPLSDALQTLLNDDALRRTMGERARQLGRDQFDSRVLAQQVVAVYRRVLAKA